jgi:hypothetical protein
MPHRFPAEVARMSRREWLELILMSLAASAALAGCYGLITYLLIN